MIKVWISRPRRRAVILARELKKLEIIPVIRPAMRIVGISEKESLNMFISRERHADMAIFVSEEGVRRCRGMTSSGNPLPVFGVGAATTAALSSIPGFNIAGTGATDSESLLKLQLLQEVRDKTIAVVGGVNKDGGGLSPPLCEELQKRGANVWEVPTYCRLPSLPDSGLSKLGGMGELTAAVAYSGDTASYMLEMNPSDNDWLRRIPLFVIHRNIAETAKSLGYHQPIVSPSSAEEMAGFIAKHLSGGV